MAGYTRQRNPQIVNNSLADANDVKVELDQVQSAFNATSGHRHNGTVGEGAPIIVTGPAQEYVYSGVGIIPKTDNTYDLGSALKQFRNAYIGGTLFAENISGDFSGNASTATKWQNTINVTLGPTAKSVDGSANVAWTLSELGVNNSTLTLATSGIATGSQTWTANQGANATFTVNVPATNLSYTGAASVGTINSSTGTNVEIPAATSSQAGLLTASDKTKLDQVTGTITAAAVPPGGIIMWSGLISNIPSGWLLCNGSNGTPDLRDRFIVGAGLSYAQGNTGGQDSVSLTSSQIPSHAHSFSGTTGAGGAHSHSGTTDNRGSIRLQQSISKSIVAGGNVEVTGGTYDDGNNHFHSLSIDTAANHTHSFSGTTGSSGSGQAHENRPPYFALAFIMKS